MAPILGPAVQLLVQRLLQLKCQVKEPVRNGLLFDFRKKMNDLFIHLASSTVRGSGALS